MTPERSLDEEEVPCREILIYHSAKRQGTPASRQLTVARFDISMNDLIVGPSFLIDVISRPVIHGQAGFDQIVKDVP